MRNFLIIKSIKLYHPNFNISVFGENIFYLSDNFSITPGLDMSLLIEKDTIKK